MWKMYIHKKDEEEKMGTKVQKKISPRSAKAKGRNHQNHIRDTLKERFSWSDDDISTAIMGERGVLRKSLDLHKNSSGRLMWINK